MHKSTKLNCGIVACTARSLSRIHFIWLAALYRSNVLWNLLSLKERPNIYPLARGSPTQSFSICECEWVIPRFISRLVPFHSHLNLFITDSLWKSILHILKWVHFGWWTRAKSLQIITPWALTENWAQMKF